MNSEKVETDNEILAEEGENDDEYQIAADETGGKISVIRNNIDDKTTHETEYVVNIFVGHSIKGETVLYRVR